MIVEKLCKLKKFILKKLIKHLIIEFMIILVKKGIDPIK